MSKLVTSKKEISRACSFRYLSTHKLAVLSLSDYTFAIREK